MNPTKIAEPESKITSYDVKKALQIHCYKDFFITEVKSGPTQIDQYELKILDAMSIAKSWVHPCVKGFEVKVSRSDFLRDPKWYTYFPLVNEFYMVCPERMIEREEIPTTCGLLWYRPHSKTIVTKQKATYTGGQPTADMLMYVIMNKLDSDRTPFFSLKAEQISEYLRCKEDKKHIGYILSTKMAQRVAELEEKLHNYEEFESDAKRVRSVLDEIDKVLKKHGTTYWSSYRDDGRAQKIEELLTKPYPKELDTVASGLHQALDAVEDLRKVTT
jgi:hypothetical protein